MTGEPTGRRQRSLHCKPDEQAMIRARAEAAGKTVSRYVLDLALADDPDRHPVVLTPDEQAELRDGVRELRAFVRAENDERASTARILPVEVRTLARRGG